MAQAATSLLATIGDLRSCKICFWFLGKKILQCRNGHTICESCYNKYRATCPECRTPFGEQEIRNLALEQILNHVDFPCEFQDKGCVKMLKNWECEQHAEACYKNPSSPFCKILGFEVHQDCGLDFDLTSKVKARKHFMSRHDAGFDDFGKRIKLMDLNQFITYKSASRWPQFRPVVISPDTAVDEGPLFLICEKITETLEEPRHFISLVCIQIWGPKEEAVNYKVEFHAVDSTFINKNDRNKMKHIRTQSVLTLSEARDLDIGEQTITKSLLEELAELATATSEKFLLRIEVCRTLPNNTE